MPTAEVRRRSQLIQRDLDAQRALALVQRQADLVLDAVTHVVSDVERLNRALEQVRRTQELMLGSALGASAPTRREVAA